MGPGRQVEISDSIELCIVELTRVDCTWIEVVMSQLNNPIVTLCIWETPD